MRYFPLLLILLLVACKKESDSGLSVDEPTEDIPSPNLITTEDAAVPLSVFYYADSSLLITGDSLSPEARFEISTVVPHAADEALNLAINKDLASLMAGDEVPIKVSNLPQTLQSAVATTLYNYRRQNIDTAEVRDIPQAYTLELFYETEVILNTAGFLSLMTSHYSYAGGAHGNYYTDLSTYSVASATSLSLSNIFEASSLGALGELLTDNTDRDQLDDPEGTVEPTENFALTEAGINFTYPPYEIAPYTAGEIEIVLPYAMLKPLIKPEAWKLLLPLTEKAPQ